MEVAFHHLANRLKRFGVYSPRIDDALRAMRPAMRHVCAGQQILERQSKGADLFLVKSGWVALHHDLEDGRRQILDIALPGTFTGLLSWLEIPMPYCATALTDAEMVWFSRDTFFRAVDACEHLQTATRRLIAHEVVIQDQHLVNIGLRSAAERLLHFLLETRWRLEAVGLLDGECFSLPIPQSTLGMVLGLTTVHTNRTLQSLRRHGLVETCPAKCVRIADIDEAARLCGFDPSYLN